MTAIRRPGAASATVLIVLSAGLVTAHLCAPEWSRRAGLDVWNLAALESAYETAAENRADIQAHGEQAAARRAAANQVATELIDGAIDLATAADELADVFRHDPAMRTVLEMHYAETRTERLLFARHAIDRAETLLCDDPVRRAATVARLKAEYRALCAAPESPHGP